MAVSGGVRVAFLIFNLLFWAVGIFLCGFISWTLATNPSVDEFLDGRFWFSYTLLAIGAVIFLLGSFGCIGGMTESTCLLKTYVAFTTILLLLEIGGVIGAYIQRGDLLEYSESGWNEFNTETRNYIQKEMQCCGFHSYTDYGKTLDKLDDSCFKPSAGGTFTTRTNNNVLKVGCWEKIDDWLNANIPIWASVIGVIALIEILSLILSCLVLKRVQKAQQVSPHDVKPVHSHRKQNERF